jgi:hypothetical protein
MRARLHAKNTHRDALADQRAIPEETDMTHNPDELTVENSAVVLIDHQPWVAFAFAFESIDRSVLINNVTGLAHAAKNLGVPTVVLQRGGGAGLALG